MVLYFHSWVFGTIFLRTNLLDAASSSSRAKQSDFAKGDQIPEGLKHECNFGHTGTLGWIFGNRLETSQAQQILITMVDSDSPADGTLMVRDVILGLGNIPLGGDPRTEFGRAIGKAEIKGELNLLEGRKGKTENVTVKLPILGGYANTAPWKWPQSEKTLLNGLQVLATPISDPVYKSVAKTRSINALALLASGKKEYQPLIKKEVDWASDFSSNGYMTWHYGYVFIFLPEYIIATADQTVLPGLRRLAIDSAYGQSVVGFRGHRIVRKETGRLGGYSMMHSPGLPLTIGLVLSKKAGVKDPVASKAIEKSAKSSPFLLGERGHSIW